MTINTYLAEQKIRIEAYLREYADTLEGIPSGLKEAIEYSLFAGGKRIRPILCLAACKAVNGDESAALAAGCAIEMIHTYSLIHDDLPCMDNDDMRRGKATSHVKFGEAGAVLAGDGLQSLAFELICSRIEKPSLCRTVLCLLAEAAGPAGMVGGQVLDLEFEKTPCSEAQLNMMHGKKTGAIIHASVIAGAHCGEYTQEEFKALSDYGIILGLLFQVVDDILDSEGDAEKLGKSTGKDEASHKSTYVTIRGLEGAKAYRDELYKKSLKALEIFSGRDTILNELSEFTAFRDH